MDKLKKVLLIIGGPLLALLGLFFATKSRTIVVSEELENDLKNVKTEAEAKKEEILAKPVEEIIEEHYEEIGKDKNEEIESAVDDAMNLANKYRKKD